MTKAQRAAEREQIGRPPSGRTPTGHGSSRTRPNADRKAAR